MEAKCFICGGQVMWTDSASLDDLGMEESGIVTFLTCSECGAEYEVYQMEESDGRD